MTEAPLRVAVLGMGWWSDVLSDAIKRSTEIDIVACFTRSEDKRLAFAQKYGCRPAASYEEMEEIRRLYACLNELEGEKKEIVLLAYHYGLTREEIARRVNRPVPTVKTWLRRSLEQIKSCLGQ